MFGKDKPKQFIVVLNSLPEKLKGDAWLEQNQTMDFERFAHYAQSTFDAYLDAVTNFPQTGLKTIAKIDDMLARMEMASSRIGALSSHNDCTELLAINAAIEAAKSGAEGVGFMKVASEVLKLAQKSEEFSHSIIKEFSSAKSTIISTKSTVIQAAEEETLLAMACKSQVENILGEFLQHDVGSGEKRGLSANKADSVHGLTKFDRAKKLFSAGVRAKESAVKTPNLKESQDLLRNLKGIVNELVVRLEKILKSDHVEANTKSKLSDVITDMKSLESAEIFVKKH